MIIRLRKVDFGQFEIGAQRSVHTNTAKLATKKKSVPRKYYREPTRTIAALFEVNEYKIQFHSTNIELTLVNLSDSSIADRNCKSALFMDVEGRVAVHEGYTERHLYIEAPSPKPPFVNTVTNTIIGGKVLVCVAQSFRLVNPAYVPRIRGICAQSHSCQADCKAVVSVRIINDSNVESCASFQD